MKSIVRNTFPAVYLALLLCIFAPLGQAKRLPIKIYNSADGLGSSFVDYLMRDSKGFLWFCTRDGLSRFDGSQFVTYQIGEKGAVSGIESIYEQRNGTYWVGTTTGLYRFSSETLSQPNPTKNGRPLLNAEYIGGQRGHMWEDRNGQLFFFSNTISKVVESNGKAPFERVDLHLSEDLARGLNISEQGEDAEGSIWFNAPRGVVRRLPDGRVVFYETEKEFAQASVLVDKNNRVWVLRAKEILIFKPEPVASLFDLGELTLRPLKPDASLSVKSGDTLKFPENAGECFRIVSDEFLGKHVAKRLLESSDGHIWITTEENLIEYDGSKLYLHTPKEGFVPGMARMVEDAAGNLWFGGFAGLVRLDRKGLITYDTADGLASSRIYSITEDSGGRLYAGTGEMSLSQFDGKGFRAVFPKTLPDSSTLWTSRFAMVDREGEWWLASDQGLHHFEKVDQFSDLDGKTPSEIYNKSTGLRNNEAFHLFEDKNGDIWFSYLAVKVADRDLLRWNRRTGELYTFTEADGFPKSKAASAYAEDGYGNLWLGFYEGGIARYRDGKFTVFGSEFGLPTNVITDLHIDQTGRMWISSATGGLMRIDDTNAEVPAIIHFSTDDGLTSNNIRTITEDDFGRIYLGTVHGVDRLSPDTMRVKHYTVNDGLASDFVVDSRCDKNGVLWFATTNGLSSLEPTLESEQEPPKVFLGKLIIAGEVQSIPELGTMSVEKGELSSSQNNLQIDFFGLDFRAGERLRYQYKFEADADWSPPSEQRQVTYAKLSPDSYRFLVRAVNSEGAVSEQPAIVTFKILPPIWQRWWFLVLASIAIAGLIVLLYRYRTARLLEINAALEEAHRAEERLRRSREERLAELETVRSRIATDLHDDIGASLTQIAILSEVAQTKSGSNGNGALAEPLTKITEVSNELVGTMSDIVWSINPSKDHLSDLTQRMRRFAADVLSPSGVPVRFSIPEAGEEITLNSNVRRELFLVFKESVNNIAKHSGAASVDVKLEITKVEILLKIADDGKGFENAPPSFEDTFSSSGYSGNGIASMHKRAKALNGHFEVISKPGKGTTILVRLPREQTFDDSIIPNARATRK